MHSNSFSNLLWLWKVLQTNNEYPTPTPILLPFYKCLKLMLLKVPLHDAIYSTLLPLAVISVTPHAPSLQGGGGVSEILLINRTLLDNLLQQNDQYGVNRLASRWRQLVVPLQLSHLTVSNN